MPKISSRNTKHSADPSRPIGVGLVVVFAALAQDEEQAIRIAWEGAAAQAAHWQPGFFAFGVEPLPKNLPGVDVLVYLGESSRFARVAEETARRIPVVFVKSTVEELLQVPTGGAPRYRMSTGVDGIAQALAQAAPAGPTVDWTTLPWPVPLAGQLELETAEQTYVDKSLAAFRQAAEKRGNRWVEGLPQGPFSVFLTMHDPLAARLADTALRLWPECTPIAADGMSSTHAPNGKPWSERLMRVRHWTSRSRSANNRRFHAALGEGPLPDIDSPGMLFGTLTFLDHAFAAGADPQSLDQAGRQPGPLGLMKMTASGRPDPERVIVFSGRKWKVIRVNA